MNNKNETATHGDIGTVMFDKDFVLRHLKNPMNDEKANAMNRNLIMSSGISD